MPVIPILSILCCLVLMASLPLETWVRFLVWLAIGLTIYFSYSRHRSEFGRAPRRDFHREGVATRGIRCERAAGRHDLARFKVQTLGAT